MFYPVSSEYEYKVIVTNKGVKSKKVLEFHNGRGAQEAIFADAKNNVNMEYVAVKKLNGNKVYFTLDYPVLWAGVKLALREGLPIVK